MVVGAPAVVGRLCIQSMTALKNTFGSLLTGGLPYRGNLRLKNLKRGIPASCKRIIKSGSLLVIPYSRGNDFPLDPGVYSAYQAPSHSCSFRGGAQCSDLQDLLDVANSLGSEMESSRVIPSLVIQEVTLRQKCSSGIDRGQSNLAFGWKSLTTKSFLSRFHSYVGWMNTLSDSSHSCCVPQKRNTLGFPLFLLTSLVFCLYRLECARDVFQPQTP